MSLASSFDHLSFQRKVQDALQAVERVLEMERKPRLADNVDHTYGAKYELVNSTSNAAIIACMNCFEKMGLDEAALKSVDETKPTTLRFDASTSCEFLEQVNVDLPLDRSYEEVTTESEPSKTTTKTKVMKAINHVTEFHWEVGFTWSISIYSGTSVEEKNVLKSRKCTARLITQTKQVSGAATLPPIELSLTWLLQQIDIANLTSHFKVDVEDDSTKTPRRNDTVDKAFDFVEHLRGWCSRIGLFFGQHLQQNLLLKHNPALPEPQHAVAFKNLLQLKDRPSIFNPIQPIMEEGGHSNEENRTNNVDTKSMIGLQCAINNDDDRGPLLSSRDISLLLNEHVRTLNDAVRQIDESWPLNASNNILSSSEAALYLLIVHLRNLSSRYTDSMSYVESMMENQLIAAIGKRVTPKDLDKFVKFHNARLLRPMPRPFSHAIRRPEHYPVGLLSIESVDGENECIHSHSREIIPTSKLKIPLSAATVLELTGQQYLHGYMNHRFGSSHKRLQMVARARQFSAFILVIGNMTDESTLDPKDAIIVQNKDEVLIPLLLEELPTAKEFKDAIQSLSPEQQRFARAYRKMQLASSVFGVCVIQIKPQLEALLGLPADSLDKEMKMTQDLMELFVEHQIPSDLLSCIGFSEDVATEDKISNVRDNVKSVMGVIDGEKEKQLKSEQAKTEMAVEKASQNATGFWAPAPFSSAPCSSAPFSSAPADGAPMMQMQQVSRSPAPGTGFSFGGPLTGEDQFYSGFSAAPTTVGAPAPETLASFGSSGGGLFGSTASAQPASATSLFRSRTSAPAADLFSSESPSASTFGSPAPAPAAGLFGSVPTPATDGRLGGPSAKRNIAYCQKAYSSQPPKQLCNELTSSADVTTNTKRATDKSEGLDSIHGGGKRSKKSSEIDQSKAALSNQGVDFTVIPQTLDAAVEKSGEGNVLRSTTIKTGDNWYRNRQENLLTPPKGGSFDVSKEKNKAFDLLDALSRSGSLPIAYSELHVVVAVTHVFDKDVMSTVVCDDVNPIEKLECSTLLLASVVHGIPPRELIGDDSEMQRLEGSLPLLLGSSGTNKK